MPARRGARRAARVARPNVPWVPLLAGVGVLIGFLVTAFTLAPHDARQRADEALDPITEAAAPIPAVTSPRPAERTPERASASTPGLAATTASAATTAPTSQLPHYSNPVPSLPGETALVVQPGGVDPGGDRVEVAAAYRVLNSYADSFIAEVLVTNPTPGVRHWSVQIAFEDDVTGLRTYWVESAPQATMSRTGPLYTFISTVPLSAGSSVSLRLHFERSGPDGPPQLCTVNGATCALS